jgi:hypothetical protein
VDRPPARVDRCAADDLFSRESKDSFGAAIAYSNAAVAVEDDNAILHRREDRPVVLLAFQEHFLRLLPCGNVPCGRVEQLSARIRGRSPGEPPVRSIFAAVPILERDGLDAFNDLLGYSDSPFPVRRVDEAQIRFGKHFVDGITKGSFKSWIKAFEIPIEPGDTQHLERHREESIPLFLRFSAFNLCQP